MGNNNLASSYWTSWITSSGKEHNFSLISVEGKIKCIEAKIKDRIFGIKSETSGSNKI